MSEPTALSAPDPAADAPQGSGALRLVKILVGVALLGALIFFGRQAGDYFLAFAEWVKGQGTLGPVIFIVGYAVGVIAAAPGAVLTMLGGAIFGLGWGTLFVFCGSTLGSAGAFLIARYLARGAVEKKITSSPKFSAIDKAVGRQGFKIVFLLRLTPVFPFSFGNYALGLTRVRFLDYLLAAFGTIPGTFLYVYYGKAAGDLAALAAGGGAAAQRGPAEWALLGVGLAATIAVTVVVTKIARKALDQSTDLDAVETTPTDNPQETPSHA